MATITTTYVSFSNFIFCVSVQFFLVSLNFKETFQVNFLWQNSNPDDVHFYMFTNSRDPYEYKEIKYLDEKSFADSGFVSNRYTAIFIHGYTGSPFENDTAIPLMSAFLKSGIKGNFISVDWRKLSSPSDSNDPFEFATGYLKAVKNIKVAGTRVSDFLIWLDTIGVLRPENVHLIGNSLGAQVAGLAGQLFCCKKDGLKISRVTGLDPSGPLTETPLTLSHVVSREDATFVDIFHSNVGMEGSYEKKGDAEFFLNGITVQPGCLSGDLYESIQCSHLFSVRVFAASLLMPIVACMCPNWNVLSCFSTASCMNPTLVGFTPYTTRGVFYVKTHGIS